MMMAKRPGEEGVGRRSKIAIKNLKKRERLRGKGGKLWGKKRERSRASARFQRKKKRETHSKVVLFRQFRENSRSIGMIGGEKKYRHGD